MNESLPFLSPEQVLQLLRAHAEMSENLTAVQKRCGELLEDNRRLRGELADARDVPEPTARALQLVVAERDRQNAKWHRAPGEFPVSDDRKHLILAEETGEIAKALLEGDPDEHLLEEVVQVAAVATCWAEVLILRIREARRGGP